MWKDLIKNTCESCDPSCLTCKSPGTSLECLSCNTGFLNNGQCSICSTTCKTCDISSTSCTSCSGSTYLSNNECSVNCPDGYYASSSTNTCELCNKDCLTCDGEFSSDCLSCIPGKVLGTGRCLSCATSCITCEGTGANNCLSCDINLYLQEKSCVSDCKTGYYKTETPTKQCIKCSTTCLNCVSSSFNDCLTCANNCYFTVLDPVKKTGSCTYLSCPLNMIMNPDNLTHLEKCDSNKYFDSKNNRCKTCNSECLTCSGGTVKDCLSCIEGLFLSEVHV